MHRRIILFIIVLLSINSFGQNIKLDRGEHKFKWNYSLKEYNFAWRISYFEVVSYHVDVINDTSFKISKYPNLNKTMQVGHLQMNTTRQKELQWLSKAILSEDYFWKEAHIPSVLTYTFTSLRFIDESGKFKAIDKRQDILDMMGNIDNEAKLHLWLYSSRDARYISYKKINNLYRVRYSSSSGLSCRYEEFFNYYNNRGKLVKTKKVKSYKIKGCTYITI